MLNPRKLRVAVELTSCCNLSCAMCPLRSMKRPLEAMPFERLKKVHTEIRELGLKVRWLHEMGEPLLYPQLKEALDMFPEAILSTNGMALKGGIAEIVLASPIQTVRICLDTINPKAYPSLRTGGNFQKVVHNIKAFLEAARRKPVRIEIQKMVSKLTKGETRKDFIRFFNLEQYPNAAIIEKTCEALDTSGETELHGKYAGCFQGGPFNWLVILANGAVTHCCYDYEGAQAIGNVDETPLRDILNSPKLAEIEKAFHAKDFSGLPRCCECFRLEDEVRTYPALLYRLMRLLPFKDRLRRWFM